MIRGAAKILTVFLVFLLFLSPVSVSAGIEDEILENPAGVGELLVRILYSGLITVDGTLTSISINMSMPQEDERQEVDIDVEKQKDELGTYLGVIEEENPGNSFEYSFSGTVRSRANHLYSLPASYVIPEEVEIYLMPTENIQSSDPDFRELAQEITSGSKDDFEKVARLAVWVYDSMEYDLSYSDRNVDAVTVLEERRGVCAEYTTLFVALARSIGIPARFISGYAYGNMGWERHAYAEVYLGRWVPVDPLWLEIGYLDATHLKFGQHADNYVRNNLQVYGYGVKNINWVKDDVTLTSISYSETEKEGDYELNISSEEFRKGDEGIVTLSIIPQEFIVGRISLEPCSGQYGIAEVEDKVKKVILRPGQKEQIYWKIRINPDLPKNFIFTCPLTLNSRSLDMRTVNATANTLYKERSGQRLSAHLSSDTIGLGDKLTVYLKVEEIGSDSWVGVIAENRHERYGAGPGEFVSSFTFVPESLGINKVVVYTSEGDVAELEFEVMSEVDVSVEDFSVPLYLKLGERKNVSARIVNHGSSEQNVRLNIKVDGEDNLANILLRNAHLVSLPVSFSEPGVKRVSIEVSGEETDLTETRVIEVYREPAVSYDAVHEEGKGLLMLEVMNSPIMNVTITVGGIGKQFDQIRGEKAISFDLAPGEYPLTIECRDMGGNPYEVSETIDFRQKNFLEIIMEAISSFFQEIAGLFG